MRTAGLILFLLLVVPAAFAQTSARVVPPNPTTATPVSFAVTHVLSTNVTIARTGNLIRIDIGAGAVIDPLPFQTDLYDIGVLPAGNYTVQVYELGNFVQTFNFAVLPAIAPALSWPAIALLALTLVVVGWIAIGRQL